MGVYRDKRALAGLGAIILATAIQAIWLASSFTPVRDPGQCAYPFKATPLGGYLVFSVSLVGQVCGAFLISGSQLGSRWKLGCLLLACLLTLGVSQIALERMHCSQSLYFVNDATGETISPAPRQGSSSSADPRIGERVPGAPTPER